MTIVKKVVSTIIALLSILLLQMCGGNPEPRDPSLPFIPGYISDMVILKYSGSGEGISELTAQLGAARLPLVGPKNPADIDQKISESPLILLPDEISLEYALARYYELDSVLYADGIMGQGPYEPYALRLPYAPGELIVGFHSDADEATIRDIHSKVGATPIDTNPFLYADLVQLPKKLRMKSAIDHYKTFPAVKYVELNYSVETLEMPPTYPKPDFAVVGVAVLPQITQGDVVSVKIVIVMIRYGPDSEELTTTTVMNQTTGVVLHSTDILWQKYQGKICKVIKFNWDTYDVPVGTNILKASISVPGDDYDPTNDSRTILVTIRHR